MRSAGSPAAQQSVLLDSSSDKLVVWKPFISHDSALYFLSRILGLKKEKGGRASDKAIRKIEQFLDLCASCKPAHDFSLEIVTRCEKITSDYLHALELGNFTYGERARMSTAERKNRIERRAAKDIVELNEALRKWLDLPETKAALNMLKQTLGEVRKIERYHANRTYVKKVE